MGARKHSRTAPSLQLTSCAAWHFELDFLPVSGSGCRATAVRSEVLRHDIRLQRIPGAPASSGHRDANYYNCNSESDDSLISNSSRSRLRRSTDLLIPPTQTASVVNSPIAHTAIALVEIAKASESRCLMPRDRRKVSVSPGARACAATISALSPAKTATP